MTVEAELIAFAKWLGIPVFSGIAAWLAAYGAIKYASKKAVEQALQKDLKKFEHELTAKIEGFRFDVSASLDRTSKLHEKEFTVLPRAWHLLHVSAGATGKFAYRNIPGRPIVEPLEPEVWSRFLDTYEFSDIDKDRLRQYVGQERQQEFDKAVVFLEIQAARKAHSKFNNYLLSYGIFIQKPLRDRFKEFSTLIRDANHEADFERQLGPILGTDRFKSRDLFTQEWKPKIEEFEADIQRRLWEARLPSIDQRTGYTPETDD